MKVIKSIFIVILIIAFISFFLHKRYYLSHKSNNYYELNITKIDSEKVPSTDSATYNTIIGFYKSYLPEGFYYKGFSYFVVISNLSQKETDDIINNTINKAVECFYNDYFSKKPDDITTIFLFKNDETYRFWAKKLFSDDDLSRFGYYKPDKKIMIMNISTGTGTLVHELTHALVRYDFPDIPAWFNEGLGSLYEHSSLSNGVILGYVNWRLPTLQDAINGNTYTSLSQLIKTSEEEFYGGNSGFYYSQARYFCMFMQQKNLLRKFYKSFRDNYENDKTGKSDIEKTFGQNLDDIDKDYVNWVKTLKYD